jgi:flagellar hook assembly protein FlgD
VAAGVVRMRRAVTATLVVLACAVPASAALPRGLRQTTPAQTLMPGVTYQRLVQFTSRGPVVYHVLTAPKPGGLYALKPVLSNGAIVGKERLTGIEGDAALQATTAGINGDFFAADGRPSGILIRNGALDAAPLSTRSSIGLDASGQLRVDRIAYNGYWKGSGQRRPLQLNAAPAANAVTLYTGAWGSTTPPESGPMLALTFSSFPATAPNTDFSATVSSVQHAAGGVAIPPGGSVIVARGSQIDPAAQEAPVGSTVSFRLPLTPAWSGVTDALGGGPVIVRSGKAVFRANELFSTDQLAARTPRSAVGQLADGRIVLVAVDGRQPGYSVGVSNFELALALQQLGCVTASALDGGSSTALAFEGRLLNRPADPGGERELSEALLVEYFGVYLPAPAVDVLSPNGDGVDEQQTLAYKLVRPSTVTASLVGPDGVTRPIDSGHRDPGTYTFTWPGTGEPEGRYQLTVSATDEQGQASSATRAFALDNTLGFLSSPSGAVLRKTGDALVASYRLTRGAVVTAQVETASGIVVRTLLTAQQGAGSQTVTWDGRLAGGALAYGGSYRLVVAAQNAFGTATLAQPFTARRA